MSNPILVMGESGTGKTTSLRTLNPKETFIIQVIPKPLPFKNWTKNYVQVRNKEDLLTNNLYICQEGSEAHSILNVLDFINKNRKDIKNVIIDDFQYLMSVAFMRKVNEKGYEKFTEIGKDAYNVIMKPLYMRNDINVICLTHSEKDETGQPKVKTIGKMLDDKINLCGLFTIVLHSFISDKRYLFQTNLLQNVKSPLGMFDNQTIDNDMQFVLDCMKKYNEDEIGGVTLTADKNDFFSEEKEEIQVIGTSTIDKIKQCLSLEDLKNLYLSLSNENKTKFITEFTLKKKDIQDNEDIPQ